MLYPFKMTGEAIYRNIGTKYLHIMWLFTILLAFVKKTNSMGPLTTNKFCFLAFVKGYLKSCISFHPPVFVLPLMIAMLFI